MSALRLAVLYEHEEWFRPLLAELDRRGLEYAALDAARFSYDPAERRFEYPLVVNRLSPSAFLRRHGQSIFFGRDLLRHLEGVGVEVINGYQAYVVETSKAAQIEILERLAVPYPRTRIVNHVSRIVEASQGLEFPIVVKPNIGGSGAGIRRFAGREELAAAVAGGQIDLGIDSTALVQEFLPCRDGAVVRVEVLDGQLLYAIRLFPPSGEDFNLCPADICQDDAEVASTNGNGCVREAEKRRVRIEAHVPTEAIVDQALAIAREAHLDVGGIEYLIDDRDGRARFYDVNALSNFVTDAPRLIGFDPHEKFVDYLADRIERHRLDAQRRVAGTGIRVDGETPGWATLGSVITRYRSAGEHDRS